MMRRSKRGWRAWNWLAAVIALSTPAWADLAPPREVPRTGPTAPTPTSFGGAPLGSAASSARPKPSSSASSSANSSASAGAPAQPPTQARDADEDDDGHAHAAHGGAMGGVGADIPEDTVKEDPTIPPGSIVLHIVDPSGAPLAQTDVTLGIIENSVAKGENRKRLTGKTDGAGTLRFDGQATGSITAYRVSVAKSGATFALPPFQLGAQAGVNATLHVYPVTHNIEEAVIVMQSAVYFEVKDDRIQFEQAFMVYNLGKTAWVPQNLMVALPQGHKAVNGQQAMSDVGIDPVEGEGVRVRGTFAPGKHEIQFRWQLPYEGQSNLKIELGLPPHMASSRVIASAAQGMQLDVKDFPSARSDSDGQGQRVLISEKQLTRADAPLTSLQISVQGIPHTGLPDLAIQAACLAAFAIMSIAIALGFSKRQPKVQTKGQSKSVRERLLAELVALEEAKAAGEIGPKTYERTRQGLIDELALTFQQTATPYRGAAST